MKKADSKVLVAASLGVGVLSLLLGTWMWQGASQKPAKPLGKVAESGAPQSGRNDVARLTGSLETPNAPAEFFNRTLSASTSDPATVMGSTERESAGRRIVIAGLAGPDAAGDSELELVLAPGVREPVAMLEPKEELSPAQQGALDAVLESFVSRVEAAASTSTQKDLAQVWENEKAEADAAYRILFGDSAFHQQISVAAGRAQPAAKKRATPGSPGE